MKIIEKTFRMLQLGNCFLENVKGTGDKLKSQPREGVTGFKKRLKETLLAVGDLDQLEERLRFEGSSPNQAAVNVRLVKQFGSIVRFH